MPADGVGQPGRFEIHAHHSEPAVYPEEAHETVQVCVPLVQAFFTVRRTSETGRGLLRDFGARDILVVPAGQPHEVAWRRPAGVVSLHLTDAFLADVAGRPVTLRDSAVLRDPFISAAAALLGRELAAGPARSERFVDAVATAIAWRVAAAASADAAAPVGSPMLTLRQIALIEAVVEERMDATLPLADLAQVVNLGVSQFARRFSVTMGVSPHDFVVRKRLERARLLLSGTDRSITQIALDVGMTHSHFSRTFLRAFGASPRQFRRLSRL